MSTAEMPEQRSLGARRTVEALLFLAPDPVSGDDLAEASAGDARGARGGAGRVARGLAPGARGIELRELAGGLTLATSPDAEPAARRLLAKPRTPPLTPAQAETLAIVAYLQPVSRPEITRIRGVSADSAPPRSWSAAWSRKAAARSSARCSTARRRCSSSSSACAGSTISPTPRNGTPSPEEDADLRDRLLRAGEARAPSATSRRAGDA